MQSPLKGISTSSYCGAKLSPINLEILKLLVFQVSFLTLSKFKRVKFQSVYLLMHFAGVRVGKAVKSNNPEQMLRIEQLDNLVNNDDPIC